MRHAIETAALTRMYGSAVGVVDIDLAVERGRCVGLLGPNGSGKTTLIRLLLGLIRPSAGRATVMGHDVASARPAALAEVGYLPGELGLQSGLPGRRVLDALGRLHPRPPALRDELCAVLGLGPDDLRRRVREYSRGMKQKLGLIAALQHDPPLAVLDEPTGGLDPVVQARLAEWLAARTRAGRTILLSSHVLGEVEQLCDRVAMIGAGRLLFAGPLSELPGTRASAVEVRFATPVDPARYAVAGLGAPRVEGAVHRFSLEGDPAPLLAALGRLPVTAISITPAGLEEAFRDLYGQGGGR